MSRRTSLASVAAVWTTTILACAAATAQPAADGRRPHGPPPEALAACQAAAAGAACSFNSPHGALKGSCWAPEGKPLACRPPHPPRGASAPAAAPARP